MGPITLLAIARTQSLAKRLRSSLNAERYTIRWVSSTTQALRLDLQPSVVILILPPSGGARCVTRLKGRFGAPVLALAPSEQPILEQVDASLSGPYDQHDLVEQIETLLIDHSPYMMRAAGMSLDTRSRRFQVNGTTHQLRPLGCRILALLMARAGQIVPRDELFRRVWRTDDGDNTRALDVHIAHLRRQLESDPRQPKLILTERGVGYRLQTID
jgi:two-component system KDP operon response regulator KdpE